MAGGMAAFRRGYPELAWDHLKRLPRDILLGVLQAEAGTVPRALAHAGVDRGKLKQRAAARLGEWH